MRTFWIVAGVGLLISGGALHGYWTGRWTAGAAAEAAATRLAGVPRTLGDWEGTDQEMDVRERRMAGAVGYVLRRYVNRRTGAAVTMYLVCGRPGPVSVHTPDVCYAGAGYKAAGDPSARSVPLEAPPGAADFKSIRVENEEGAGAAPALRIFWSWNAGGKWQAPARPRLAFARYPVLHKLYVIEAAGDREQAGDDPAVAFIQLLLPELHKCLFSAG